MSAMMFYLGAARRFVSQDVLDRVKVLQERAEKEFEDCWYFEVGK